MQIPSILQGESLTRLLQGAAVALVTACYALLAPKSAALQ
jgi:hypothetical protein